MTRKLLLTLPLFAGLLVPAGLFAQAKNLQVLPADMEMQELRQLMFGVSQALGVRCDFCHVPQEFEKDDKHHKEVARSMIKMVMNIRQNADEFMPDGRVAKLNCWTCHRGSAEIAMPEMPGSGGNRGKKGGKKGGRKGGKKGGA